MHCPECGCELTLDSEICPDCGENFQGMSDNEKKRVFNRPLKSKKVSFKTVDSSNVNGYIKEERKLKKGSSTSRGGSRFVGYDSNTVVRKEVHKIKNLIKDDEPNRPVKLDYDTKKDIEKDILGIDDEDEYNTEYYTKS